MVGSNYLEFTRKQFHTMKERGDRTLNQLKDEEKLTYMLDEESNSVATLVRHLSGNMVSRWTNFFTEDGEKESRNRPTEFYVDYKPTKEEVMEMWERGWSTFFELLDSLTVDDLLRKITIRGEEHTVVEALNRQLAHYSEHMGQLIMLVKHLEHKDWKTLSIPREKRTSSE